MPSCKTFKQADADDIFPLREQLGSMYGERSTPVCDRVLG
jgi:hypothetical protein